MSDNKMNKELEAKLWKAADALRGNISAEEYMHVVLGLMFLKHMSDKYKRAKKEIIEKFGPKSGLEKSTDVLNSDYNVPFIVPEKATWEYIAPFATDNSIGEKIDNAFRAIEDENSELKGLFSKNYSREELDQGRLGQVVSEFSNLKIDEMGEDVIGRTYEYFLGQFFKKKGSKGGEFYTPSCIVELMVEIVNPTKGKLYDPTAGTGGMLIQAKKHLIENNKNPNFLKVYGQEYQTSTWKLSKINLLLHGFSLDSINMGNTAADSFSNDLHKGETFDFILANPPFNLKNWGQEGLEEDKRFKWGLPPKNNANYAFLSHMVAKLKENGVGATVLANGSLSSSTNKEKSIRKALLEENLIDAIITLPEKLFYTTTIPACIWVFKKNKKSNNILMIDASNFEGNMISKKLRTLTKKDIKKLSNIYEVHKNNEPVEIKGLARTITKEELLEDMLLVPSMYIQEEEVVVDKEQIRKEINDLSKEISSLLDGLGESLPKVKEAIKRITRKGK